MKKKNAYKKPNAFIYKIFYLASKLVCKFKLGLKIERNDLKQHKSKDAFVVLSKHAAAIDFMPACVAIKRRVHFIISNSFYAVNPIKPLLKAVKVIPKNQFQTAVSDLRKMKAALDNDMPLVLYPAGLMTENGVGTPIPAATGKSLKWFNRDVYIIDIKGSYLTNPKWGKGWRKGKIRLSLYKLYDAATVAATPDDELQRKIEEVLGFDEYATQKQDKIPFKGADNINGLQNVLFRCPVCGGEHTLVSDGNSVLTCEKCGYSVRANRYGLLEQNGNAPLVFDSPADWYFHCYDRLKAELDANPGYTLSCEAEIHQVNDGERRYEPVGKATVSMDERAITINGTINSQPFNKAFSTVRYPILPFKPGVHFEVQDGQTIYRIVPADGKPITKWITALKIFHLKQVAKLADAQK